MIQLVKRRRLTKAQRLQVYEKYDGKCAYCGNHISLDEMQVDHIKPLALGGADDISNFAPACRMCNYYKSTLTLEKFREQLGLLKGRLEKDFTYRLALKYGLIRECNRPVIFFFELHRDEEAELAERTLRLKIENG